MIVNNCLKGSCKCLVGIAGCPLFTSLSFTVGTVLTTKLILCGECFTPRFESEREKVCACCGLGTGIAVTTAFIISGLADMTTDRPVHVFPIFDMER